MTRSDYCPTPPYPGIIGDVDQRPVDQLISVIQQLSVAQDVAAIQDIVRHAARALTGADGATFVLRDANQCFYADEDAIAPLWKGLRFPMSACISGWTMLHRTPAAIEDIFADDRIPHEAYRPTFVKSLAMVPIRSADPLGAIGNYWANPHAPTAEELSLLQALADSTAVAMARVQVLAHLEQLVGERTAALAAEIKVRRKSEAEVRARSLTDTSTGIANRRGFLVRAEQVRKVARRHGRTSLVLFIDVDGLKSVNDTFGHGAGDRLIQEAADLLGATLREVDVLARWGGDEFVAFLPEIDDPQPVSDRIAEAVATANQDRPGTPLSLSKGFAILDPDVTRSLEDLLAEADAAMYEDKRAKRAGAALS